MVSDRLSKEELKEDRVLTAANQAMEYARKNARWVVAAVGVLVVGIVAAVLIAQGRVNAEHEAALALLRGQGLYASGDMPAATSQFETIVSRYGSTRSGRSARLFLGNAQLGQGNATGAEQSFRKFLSARVSDPVSEAGARRGLGAALALQNKPADGAAEYVKAARLEGNPLAADDWLQAGIAFLKAGNRSEAAAAFQEILDNYPRSTAVAEARIRLRESRGL